MRVFAIILIVVAGLHVPCLAIQRATVNRLAVPLSFEPNQGQAGPAVQFVARGSGYTLSLNSAEIVLNLEGRTAPMDTVRVRLVGANGKAKATAMGRQPGVVSYFIGNDPQKWRAGIPTYGRVAYPQIYPGVDLVFYGNQRQLEYDFVVAPGADAGRIAWQIDGAQVSIDAEGSLLLRTPHAPTAFKRPVLFQMDGSKRIGVAGSFAVSGNRVTFRIGRYDHSRALIIDPVLSYASYLGGTGTDAIGSATGPGILQVGASQGLAVDSAGSVYVTGRTYSIDFPTANSYQNTPPAKVAGVSPGAWPSSFITKFSPDGSSLVYSAYLGGDSYDLAYAIAVDAEGNAYVTGQTNSNNFPITAGAYQTVCSPLPNNTGISTAQSACNSSNTSAFVTKLNATGTGLVYSTFLGGFGWAYGTAIAVDASGRAYVAGNAEQPCSTSYTFEGCFPTTSDAVISGGVAGGRSPQYAYVAALDPSGAHLLYSSLFGDLNAACPAGCGGTYGTGVTVDGNGYFYLIGETSAGALPTTAGVIQPTGAPMDPTGVYVQAWRGFVAKFSSVTSPNGVSLAYGTYLGGKTESLSDYLSGIAIDRDSNACLLGYTNSKDFPVTTGTYQTVCGPNGQTCSAAHVTKLNPSGTAILWSTYVGGGKSDASDSVYFTGPVHLDGSGNIFIIGQTGGGPGFPMVNPVEPTPTGGSQEVLVAELDATGTNLLFSTHIGSNGLNTTSPAGMAGDSAGNVYVAGNTGGPSLITTPGAFQQASSDGPCCQLGNGFVAKIGFQPAIAEVVSSASFQAGIVPNSFMTIYGPNLSPVTDNWANAVIDGVLPGSLDGVSVSVGGKPAYIAYISPGQINAVAPDVAPGNVSVTVTTPHGTSAPFTAVVQATQPAFFPWDKYAVATRTDYTPAVKNGTLGLTAVPAKPGDIIILWGTGFGPTSPPAPSGTVIPFGATTYYTANPVSVTIGATAATVYNTAMTPGDAGLYQVAIQVPTTLADGDYAVVATVLGVQSPASTLLTVQK